MNDSQLVTAAKPKVGGAAHIAPLGTELPTDTAAVLNVAFKSLGYMGEDGLANANSPETDKRSAWGGDVVLTAQKSKEDTFEFTLIEALNLEVLKTVYGATNVTGDLSTGITIKANATDLPQSSWVFEMVLKGGVAKRVVLPCASIAEIKEIKYEDTKEIGYGIKLNAEPDTNGNTHYEYMKKGK